MSDASSHDLAGPSQRETKLPKTLHQNVIAGRHPDLAEAVFQKATRRSEGAAEGANSCGATSGC
jgi:hypothetical protein